MKEMLDLSQTNRPAVVTTPLIQITPPETFWDYYSTVRRQIKSFYEAEVAGEQNIRIFNNPSKSYLQFIQDLKRSAGIRKWDNFSAALKWSTTYGPFSPKTIPFLSTINILILSVN
jgi:2-polyprenyl-3-methyl-5-hydroxy-6-metoxy-1,4-benzoquinol methylase